jgi:hypothetical protein
LNSERPTAAYYRRVADEIEQLARQTQVPDVQRELLELAERFHRMAERREREPKP